MKQKDVLTDRKMTCKNVLEKLVQVQEDNSAHKTILILTQNHSKNALKTTQNDRIWHGTTHISYRNFVESKV